MEKIIIEIRASEGGADSKLLVKDLMNIYIKSCRNNNFTFKVEATESFASIWIEGKKAKSYFANESGCHRFIRVPPTEKYNRTQTSTITVAVLDKASKSEFILDKNLVEKTYTCSRGKGGQNVNRRSTCVVLKHIPTGIMVRSEETRFQQKNEELAWIRLEEKLKEIYDGQVYETGKKERFDQIGLSERSDKRRTYRIKDDLVTDHITGKSCTWKEILKGKIQLLS